MPGIVDEYYKAIKYLESKYQVVKHYDHIEKPNAKDTKDVLHKVYSGQKDIMWVYLKTGVREEYASIETSPEYIDELLSNLGGFYKVVKRETRPQRKLFFTNFDNIKDSMDIITDSIDEHTGKKVVKLTDSIHIPMLPKKIIEYPDCYKAICGRCNAEFRKANRCTTCGQKLEWPDDDELSKFLDRPMNKKRKLEDIDDWARVTPFVDISRTQAIEIAEKFLKIGFSAQVGTTDLNMVYQKENEKKMYGIFFFGDGKYCGFQPAEFIEYVTEYGLDEKIVVEGFLEEIRSFLSPNQKNVPFVNLKGYYYIELLVVYENIDKILDIYSRLINRFEENN